MASGELAGRRPGCTGETPGLRVTRGESQAPPITHAPNQSPPPPEPAIHPPPHPFPPADPLPLFLHPLPPTSIPDSERYVGISSQPCRPRAGVTSDVWAGQGPECTAAPEWRVRQVPSRQPCHQLPLSIPLFHPVSPYSYAQPPTRQRALCRFRMSTSPSTTKPASPPPSPSTTPASPPHDLFPTASVMSASVVNAGRRQEWRVTGCEQRVTSDECAGKAGVASGG